MTLASDLYKEIQGKYHNVNCVPYSGNYEVDPLGLQAWMVDISGESLYRVWNTPESIAAMITELFDRANEIPKDEVLIVAVDFAPVGTQSAFVVWNRMSTEVTLFGPPNPDRKVMWEKFKSILSSHLLVTNVRPFYDTVTYAWETLIQMIDQIPQIVNVEQMQMRIRCVSSILHEKTSD